MKRIRIESYDKIMTNFDLYANKKYVVRFKFTSDNANKNKPGIGLVRNNFPGQYLENEKMSF